MNEILLDINKIEMNCTICQGEIENPVIANCCHSFCEECLMSAAKVQKGNGWFSCPICRQVINSKREIRKNFELQSLLITLKGIREKLETFDQASRTKQIRNLKTQIEMHSQKHRIGNGNMVKMNTNDLINATQRVNFNESNNTIISNTNEINDNLILEGSDHKQHQSKSLKLLSNRISNRVSRSKQSEHINLNPQDKVNIQIDKENQKVVFKLNKSINEDYKIEGEVQQKVNKPNLVDELPITQSINTKQLENETNHEVTCELLKQLISRNHKRLRKPRNENNQGMVIVDNVNHLFDKEEIDSKYLSESMLIAFMKNKPIVSYEWIWDSYFQGYFVHQHKQIVKPQQSIYHHYNYNLFANKTFMITRFKKENKSMRKIIRKMVLQLKGKIVGKKNSQINQLIQDDLEDDIQDSEKENKHVKSSNVIKTVLKNDINYLLDE